MWPPRLDQIILDHLFQRQTYRGQIALNIIGDDSGQHMQAVALGRVDTMNLGDMYARKNRAHEY